MATQITMRRRYLTNQLIEIVADEDTGERDIAEPRKGAGRRSTQQGRQRPPGLRPPTAAAQEGRRRRRRGGQQALDGAEQLANRTTALLAKLPKDVADELRRRHTVPNELLRRTTEELNRRNAAKSRGTDAGRAAAAGEPARPEQEPQNSGQPPAREGDGNQPQPPASAQVEKHINDGMRALRLGADEQATLRKQFQGETPRDCSTTSRCGKKA